MYLYGSKILGFAANGTNLVTIDNSNALTPIVTINARLTGQLVSGGTF